MAIIIRFSNVGLAADTTDIFSFATAADIKEISPYIANAVTVDHVDNTQRLSVYGKGLSYNGTDPVGGTVTKIQYRIVGLAQFEITGLKMDFDLIGRAAFQTYLQKQALITYDNTGDTAITGSALGDRFNIQSLAGLDDIHAGAGDDKLTLIDGAGYSAFVPDRSLRFYGDGGTDSIKIMASFGTAGSVNLLDSVLQSVEVLNFAKNATVVLAAQQLGGTGLSDRLQITGADSHITITAGFSQPIDLSKWVFSTKGADFVTVNGHVDAERITGNNASSDMLLGNAGDDTLIGNGGNDALYGGENDDLLMGGSGTDDQYGGLGADQFVFKGTAFGADTIHDFDATGGQGDVIDLRAVSAIVDFNDLMAHHVKVIGDDIRISVGKGASILLVDVALADLDAADFLL